MHPIITDPAEIINLAQHIREPLYIFRHQSQGYLGVGTQMATDADWEVTALLPPLYPEWLGNQDFLRAHGMRFPYVTGSMANGIATTAIVINMARANMLGFFGAAGLSIPTIEDNLARIKTALADTDLPWGANLIHTPKEPEYESKIVATYLAQQVNRVEASAYMQINPNIVRYAATGLYQDQQGLIQRRNHIFAKISQPIVAEQFMSPPPEEILNELVAKGQLTAQEAQLARYMPLAADITVESDSGGHTDNRPLASLFSRIQTVKETCQQQYAYQQPLRMGAAGGLGSPQAIAAAFILGADYVLTGTVNQACVESGLSTNGKILLASADVTDVIMAPAADMFEMGVKLQILKKGTLFPGKASRLYEWYHTYNSIDELPDTIKNKLEKDYFRTTIAAIWQQTEQFFGEREPNILVKAAANPKHKMALIFRWYLGKSSRWAIDGSDDRQMDYQIWCGPAMGAFNTWTKNTPLEQPENRKVVTVALNLLEGAAIITRMQQLRSSGFCLPAKAFHYEPRLV